MILLLNHEISSHIGPLSTEVVSYRHIDARICIYEKMFETFSDAWRIWFCSIQKIKGICLLKMCDIWHL